LFYLTGTVYVLLADVSSYLRSESLSVMVLSPLDISPEVSLWLNSISSKNLGFGPVPY